MSPWLQKSGPSNRKPLIRPGLEIDSERPIHLQVLPGPNTLSAYSGANILGVGALWVRGSHHLLKPPFSSQLQTLGTTGTGGPHLNISLDPFQSIAPGRNNHTFPWSFPKPEWGGTLSWGGAFPPFPLLSHTPLSPPSWQPPALVH